MNRIRLLLFKILSVSFRLRRIGLLLRRTHTITEVQRAVGRGETSRCGRIGVEIRGEAGASVWPWFRHIASASGLRVQLIPSGTRRGQFQARYMDLGFLHLICRVQPLSWILIIWVGQVVRRAGLKYYILYVWFNFQTFSALIISPSPLFSQGSPCRDFTFRCLRYNQPRLLTFIIKLGAKLQSFSLGGVNRSNQGIKYPFLGCAGAHDRNFYTVSYAQAIGGRMNTPSLDCAPWSLVMAWLIMVIKRPSFVLSHVAN